jgi:hypothetical protein
MRFKLVCLTLLKFLRLIESDVLFNFWRIIRASAYFKILFKNTSYVEKSLANLPSKFLKLTLMSTLSQVAPLRSTLIALKLLAKTARWMIESCLRFS